MINQDTIIGRALAQNDYNLYVAIKRQAMPMLTDPKHISAIYKSVNDTFNDEPEYFKIMLFISTVYDCYCPGSYFHTSIMKMPVGLRDEVQRVLNLNSPESVNYYQSISKSHMKFRDRAFGQKVQQIKEQFKQFSVLEEDWKLEL